MNYQNAINSAQELLKKFDLKPPVNIRGLADSLGIIVAEAPNEDQNMSGLIFRDNEKTLIGINSLHPENRKRFTIAHELGHYKLHEKNVFVDKDINFWIKYRKKTTDHDPDESEANAFAAELLMPEEWMKTNFVKLKDILSDNSGKVDLDSIIIVLANKFQVSHEALKVRLDNLDLI